MKISKIIIRNFRGIGFAEIDVEDFTTLIGPNNIGKSTILSAILILLDNKKPQKEDWPGQKPSNLEMIISCKFTKLEDWEKRKPAISKLLHDDSLEVRLVSKWNEDQTDYSYNYYVYHELEEFPHTGLNYTDAKKDDYLKSVFEALSITKAAEYKEKIDEISEYIREKKPECIVKKLDWHLKKFANSLQQAIPHVMFVPASFKIEDELKSTNTSPFSLLFSRKLFPKVQDDDSYKEYLDKASLLQKKLKGEADDGSEIEGLGDALSQISKTLNQILDFDSQVKLAVGDIDVEPLFVKAATFLINEEIETSLEYQGSGVQRALAFAMLEGNAEIECEVSGEHRTIIVLYEEPELYIHPHLMRRLKNALQKRANSEKWQVICSTHSPFLIDLSEKPESLKLIKRDGGNKRVVKQVSSSIFEKNDDYDERTMLRAALDFHPTVCESLFAKRVVLVEGDTELAVFSMKEELLDYYSLSKDLVKDTTVISAGGKWTIPAIAKILKHLGIETKIIHDTDRKGLTDEQLVEKKAIHPYKANIKIENVVGTNNVYKVDDTFEHVLWDRTLDETIKDSDKPYNSWLRIKGLLKNEIELSDACNETFKEIVKFAFCADS